MSKADAILVGLVGGILLLFLFLQMGWVVHAADKPFLMVQRDPELAAEVKGLRKAGGKVEPVIGQLREESGGFKEIVILYISGKVEAHQITYWKTKQGTAVLSIVIPAGIRNIKLEEVFK